MRTFRSRIANLRCPRCFALQSQFAARLTLRGSAMAWPLLPMGTARAAPMACLGCGARLICTARISIGSIYVGALLAFLAIILVVLNAPMFLPPLAVGLLWAMPLVWVLVLDPLLARYLFTLETA